MIYNSSILVSDQMKDKKIQWKQCSNLGENKNSGGLGFRELIAFNKALLAKQVWRLLQNPNSLLAIILKQKYFKYYSVLDAKVSHNPSFLWRSLTTSIALVKEGMCWYDGNGRSIQTWND